MNVTPSQSLFTAEQVAAQDSFWQQVEAHLAGCSGVAWDDCHKLYILADDAQVQLMAGHGYGSADDGSILIERTPSTSTPALLDTVQDWFSFSCALRFITVLASGAGSADDDTVFVDVIPQFADAFTQAAG